MDHRVGISDSLEKSLKIIGGQDLEAMPHMKFFDRTLPNRVFFDLHAKFVWDLQLHVFCKVKNIFVTLRFVYFW